MKKTLHKAFLAAGAFALAACALADSVGRVEYVSVDLAKRTATVAWTWTDLADSAVRLSLTRNGDDFPTAGWGGSLFIGDGTTGCAVGGTRSGFNELFFDVGRDNVPTNGRYAVQIIATNEAGRVEEWVRGTLTVRANPAAEGMPTNWTAYADIARKVAPFIDAEGILRNPANADALWDAVSNRTASSISAAASATLQSAKDYTDAAIAGAGGLTPEMVTNIVQDVAPAPGNYAVVSNAAMNALSRAEASDFAETGTVAYASGLIADNTTIEGSALVLELDELWNDLDSVWGEIYDVSAEIDNTRVEKASTNDVHLAPVYGGNGSPPTWVIIPSTEDGETISLKWLGDGWAPYAGEVLMGDAKGGLDSTSLHWEAGREARIELSATRIVNPIIGYTLGDQTDKVLASTNLQTGVSAATVTNIVREASGGIWDAALEVWWTPRMRNGSLTYEATTNVNLNAEN